MDTEDNLIFLKLIMEELGLDLDDCHILETIPEIYFGIKSRKDFYDFYIKIKDGSLMFSKNTNVGVYSLDLSNPDANPVSWVQSLIRQVKLDA